MELDIPYKTVYNNTINIRSIHQHKEKYDVIN